VSAGQFSIRIDFSPSALETRLIRVKSRPEDTADSSLSEDFRRSAALEDTGERLRAYKETISKINAEVEDLERRRMVLTALKQEVLKQASAEIVRLSPDYQQRRLLYLVTESPDTPVDEMARMLNIQREVLARMIHDFFSDEF